MTAPPMDELLDDDEMFEDRDEGGEGADDGDDGDSAAAAKPPAIDASHETDPIPGAGALLEEPSAPKVFKAIDREVERQERRARNRDQDGKHWDRVRKGVPFSYLQKSEDQSVWEAKLPPGIEDVQQPIPNKVLDLSNKQVSQILVDPFIPNPLPDGDAEKTRSAMDLAKQFLRADADPSGTNDAELFRELLTLNRTRKSAFAYVWIDPTAGGWRPKQKLAHPRATDPKNPLYAPALNPETGEPLPPDPTTGEVMMERAAEPLLRYVADVEPEDLETVEEGHDEHLAQEERFVEHAAEASREWLPKHRVKVIHPNQVRTLPPTATAAQAHSIIVLMWETLDEVRKRFAAVRAMTQPELKSLAEWRPRRWKAIVPETQRPKGDGLDADGNVSGDTLIFWYMKFCRIAPDYQDGAEIHVSGASIGGGGKGVMLMRGTLREDVETDDGLVPVLMDPPIAQFRALIDDSDSGDPFGKAPVSLYGGANEIRAHLYLSVLEDIDVRLRPNVYLTATSSVTKEDMNRRDGTPLEVTTKEDMPTFEQRPQLPAYLPETLTRVEHEMDVSANLNETAQALDSQYSESGEAKKVALRQAKVQLAQDWQGMTNGAVQYWKIKLQLAQAKLKTPQLVKAGGESTPYKARHFVGADLFGVNALALQPGTGTMMSPAEKAQYLAQGQQEQWLDKDEAGALFRSAMSDDLGLPKSPHEQRIDREIADWNEGPPPGWMALYQQHQNAKQAAAQAALSSQGQPQPGADLQPPAATPAAAAPPAAPLPPLPTPFEPTPNDEEPVVAKIRYTKLSALISSAEFKKQPKEWRTTVQDAYTAATYAAGVMTVRQQQAAQQAAQQAQAAQSQKPDPNAPPEYSEFLALAQKAVVLKASRLLAAEVSALGDANAVAEKANPEPVPAEIQPDTVLDLAHQSAENEADRQHELTVNAQTHANTMEQLHAKSAADLGATLAKADRQAAHQSGTPRPERPE